ncbi:MAG: hypothetical protein DSM106950_31025 [Stigonema ocellatum SAG 48.90 = DSM 106950]|nr:hypothetical protein [Stigonema ocellatum SAG 48.90 = DSM 106950]
MLTEEVLVQKFISVVEDRYPQLGELLHYCHVELVSSYWGLPPKLIQHFVVYYPNLLSVSVNAYKDILRDVAKDLGISNAVCMNATRIIRDPASTLKQKNPVLWLELQWVAVPTRKSNSHIDQDLLNSD